MVVQLEGLKTAGGGQSSFKFKGGGGGGRKSMVDYRTWTVSRQTIVN